MCIYKERLSSVIWSLVIDGKIFQLTSKSYNTEIFFACSIWFQLCTYYNIFEERNHQSKSDHPWFKKVDTQHKSDVNSCGFGFIFPCKHFPVKKNATFLSCTLICKATYESSLGRMVKNKLTLTRRLQLQDQSLS